jgi:hypothetical protein
LAEYLAGMRSAVTTEEPRYAAIGVVVDGDYRQLNANILQIKNEYYSTIRPKPSKANKHRPLGALRETGVDYVEVRTLDLNSADPVGMNQSELRFIEALLIYCLLSESPPISAAEQDEIDARSLKVAREGRRPGLKFVDGGRERGLSERGLELLQGVGAVAELLDADAQGYVQPRGLLPRVRAGRRARAAARRDRPPVARGRGGPRNQGPALVRGVPAGVLCRGLTGRSTRVVFCDSVNRRARGRARILTASPTSGRA